jgi:hypothetical protein
LFSIVNSIDLEKSMKSKIKTLIFFCIMHFAALGSAYAQPLPPPTVLNFPPIPTFVVRDGNSYTATVLYNVRVSQIKHITSLGTKYDYTIDFDFKNRTWNLQYQGNAVYFTLLDANGQPLPFVPPLQAPLDRAGCYYGPPRHQHTEVGSYFDTIRELAKSVSISQSSIWGDIGPCFAGKRKHAHGKK